MKVDPRLSDFSGREPKVENTTTTLTTTLFSPAHAYLAKNSETIQGLSLHTASEEFVEGCQIMHSCNS